MPKLAIKAVVTKPDGSLFYREEHEWSNVDPTMMQWFGDKLAHLSSHAKGLAGKGEDGANLTAVLSATGQPDLTISGISYKALTKFEREFHRVGGELLDIGDKKAKGKK